MLRVSSLGLRHDNLRLFSLPLHRSFTRATYQTAQTGGTQLRSFNGEDTTPTHSSDPVDGRSNSIPPPSTEMGRRNRRSIPPLDFSPRRSKKMVGAHTTPATVSPSESKNMGGGLSLAFLGDVSDSLSESSEVVSMDASDEATSGVEPEGVAREELERIMDTTESAEEAWEAYRQLAAGVLPTDKPMVQHYARLHRLARLLSQVRPRTRTVFMRLLSVLSALHKTGGNVHRWEWNLLIDSAGKGWRKTRPEDFQAALGVFRDMVTQKTPGSAFTRGEPFLAEDTVEREAVQPDIVTYTTLIHIAGRTLQHAILRHARNMLEASGISPNRITYLSLIRYFTRQNDMTGVRATLSKMREQGMNLRMDGVNACMWAFARAGRIDIASLVYRILRHNLIPEDEVGEYDIHAAIRQLEHLEGLTIPTTIKPNATTYYALIQCYAYHGELIRSLEVFREMMTVNEQMHILGRSLPADNAWRTEDTPTLPAFRAIFLGFARHGAKAQALRSSSGPVTRKLISPWTINNLQALFDSFMHLPHDARPSPRTVYWIMKAFDVLSGGAKWKLRRVWEKLTARFGEYEGGRLDRFKQRIYEDNHLEGENDDT